MKLNSIIEVIYMKKIIFGTLVTIIGVVLSVCCFTYAAKTPWSYNGIDGILGSFLGTQMLLPFILGVVLSAVGLAICFIEAYIKK